MIKPLRKLLPLVAVILLFTSCGTNTPLVPPDDESVLDFGKEGSLEVITWNLRTFPLNQSSLQTIAQIIPQMKVDVIAFQEIMDASAFDSLADLIPNYAALVYNATNTYRLAYLYDTRTVQVNDVYTIFEGETNPFPRAPYVLDLTFEGKQVYIINNHLKAFGDDYIDESDPWDEEYRRRLACQMLDQYIVDNLSDDRVVVVGDMNDQIAEPPSYNVFQVFLDKPLEYRFADMPIAQNPTYSTVSYPNYVSHIDHILLSNELFGALDHEGSLCKVINVEDYMGSWENYSDQISDHRPLGVRLYLD
jgi:endonuclease/exonuclease/phosphatase family metal-dependent hydrolase